MSISAVRHHAPPPTIIICTIEEPPGSGSKCGQPSHDGKAARCERHKDDNPTTIFGLKSCGGGIVPKGVGRPGGRRKRILPPG